MTATTSSLQPMKDPDAERAERHARTLAELAEIGMDLARDLRGQARDAASKAGPAELALAFSRVSRCVRLTLALEVRLAEERKARDRDDPVKQRARREAEDVAELAARPREEKRRNVLQLVLPEMIEALAERTFLPNEKELYVEAEQLILEELDEADVLNRPMVELIGAVCQVLGVEPDWSLWDPAEWTDQDHGLTVAELAAGCPVEKPRRRLFPRPDAPKAAHDTKVEEEALADADP